MCHALFIASAHELPLVSPTDPILLSIEVLEVHHEAIRSHFPNNWCVRYAGSSSGCSCDFHGKNSEPSRLALHHYLSILPASFQIMLYDCWEGEMQEPIQESVAASIQDLTTNDELITERRLITFTSH
jgi:hypothetical protein